MPGPVFPKRWIYRDAGDAGLQSLLLEAEQPDPEGEKWFTRPDEALANPNQPNRKENPMAKGPKSKSAPKPQPKPADSGKRKGGC